MSAAVPVMDRHRQNIKIYIETVMLGWPEDRYWHRTDKLAQGKIWKKKKKKKKMSQQIGGGRSW